MHIQLLLCTPSNLSTLTLKEYNKKGTISERKLKGALLLIIIFHTKYFSASISLLAASRFLAMTLMGV